MISPALIVPGNVVLADQDDPPEPDPTVPFETNAGIVTCYAFASVSVNVPTVIVWPDVIVPSKDRSPEPTPAVP